MASAATDRGQKIEAKDFKPSTLVTKMSAVSPPFRTARCRNITNTDLLAIKNRVHTYVEVRLSRKHAYNELAKTRNTEAQGRLLSFTD